MICPNCNQTIPDGSVFCSYCGAKIEVPQPAATQVSAQNVDNVSSFPVQNQPQNTPSNNQQFQGYAAPKEESKIASNRKLIIVLLVCGSLIGLGFGINYFLKQQALSKADKELAEEANSLGAGNDNRSNAGEEVSNIKNPSSAYELARGKVNYKSTGLTIIKIVGREDYSKASYLFEFIDRDSRFNKNNYDYFKGTRVTVDETGNYDVEELDIFGGDDTTELGDFGNLKITSGRIEEIISKGKGELLAKGNLLGSIFGVFFTDDQSNLAGSVDQWEVYYSKKGEDESSGYKTLKAYVVRLKQPSLESVGVGDGEISADL